MARTTRSEPKTDVERKVFGRNAKAARKARGLSQRDAAEAAGLTQGWVSEVELGRANVTLDTMVKLARTYGTTLRALWEGEG